jgi:hypothetical protein
MKKNSSSRGLRITFHAYFIYGVSGSAWFSPTYSL